MFLIEDIIELAIQIEQNAEKVYRNALIKIADPKFVSILQWLADEETLDFLENIIAEEIHHIQELSMLMDRETANEKITSDLG